MNGSRNRVSPTEGQSSRIAMVSREDTREPDDTSKKLRDQWPCKIDSLFALTAYNVNLLCVWTFPAYCFKNGGAAFFVPYILTVILCGMPLYMMEMLFGQSGGGGLVELWHCAPLFKGIGYAGVFINCTVAVYYAIYGAWTVYYLAASFRSHLLWQNCDPRNRWVTTACSLISPNCTIGSTYNETLCRSNSSDFVHYQYGLSVEPLRLTLYDWLLNFNDTGNGTDHDRYVGPLWWNWTDPSNDSHGWRLPAHDYFENEMLHAPNTFVGDHWTMYGMGYELILCLLLICLITFLALIRGAKSVGKACIIMVSLSYAFMVTVLIRTIFAFGGAAVGLKTYLFPDWTCLTKYTVWGDAAMLAFLTLFPTWGSVANIGSHNAPNAKFREDAIISTLGSAVSNVLYGFTIAIFIGILADTTRVSPLAFVTSGPHLLFVTVAQALSRLPLSPIWSSFLFFSVLSLIMGTLVIITQTIVESITRSCVSKQSTRYWHVLVTGAICSVLFLIGLGLVAKTGSQATMLLDHYCSWWNTIVLAFIELLVLIFISSRFGTKPPSNSKCCWIMRFVMALWNQAALIILILLLVHIFYPYIPASLTIKSWKQPLWSEVIGWILTSFPLICVPICFVKVWAKAEGHTAMQKLRNAAQPDAGWTKRHGLDEPETDGLNKRNLPDDVEAPPILARKASTHSGSAVMVVEPTPNSNAMVLPPPPEPAPQRPLRIAATEPALKPGKINRGTQMTRDIAIQTGDEDGEGAFVEYPEHYDHPEFMGVGGSGSRRHKKRKDKHKKKDRKHKSKDKESDREAEHLPPAPPIVPTVAFVEVAPAPAIEAAVAPAAGTEEQDHAHDSDHDEHQEGANEHHHDEH